MATTFRANVPQVYLDVDRASAKARGVSLTDLFSTLQTFLSTLYINDFNLYGRTYRVQAEAQQQRPRHVFRWLADEEAHPHVAAAELELGGTSGG